jgi:hypothetical protein
MIERVKTILSAYAAACFASGWVVALGLGAYVLVDLLIRGRWGNAAVWVAVGPFILLFAAGWATLFAVVLAFAPALVIVGLGEAARVRAAAFYGGAGTMTGIACGAYFFRREGAWLWMPGPGAELTLGQLLAPGVIALTVGTAGLVGGLVYWNMAGRCAGASTAA